MKNHRKLSLEMNQKDRWKNTKNSLSHVIEKNYLKKMN